MITAIVSTIKGPILSVISGGLGESGILRLWLWNLVPTQANMPGSDISWKLPSNLWYVWILAFLSCLGNLCRAPIRERDSDL